MKRILAILTSVLCLTCVRAERLWYRQPASEWMQALPVGNGRLGAMVWGGTDTERFSLGESTMWSGAEDPDMNPHFGKSRMDSLRGMFFAGKIAEGNSIAWHNLHGFEHSFGSHVPFGDLTLLIGHDPTEVSDYRRELLLDSAIVRVTYTYRGIRYTRECFCSHPADALVIRLTTDSAGMLAFSLGAELLRPEASISAHEGWLTVRGKSTQPGRVSGGTNFVCRAVVRSRDGIVEPEGNMISVKNATEAMVYVDLRTDYRCPAYEQLAEMNCYLAARRRYRQLVERHTTDYTELYKRVGLTLGDTSRDALPTDRRQAEVKAGKDDPALQALFFQYGRYLTITSSREDSPLPIALQGFFNDNLACNMGWNNDYHLDINTEQNYWLTGPGNLSECDAPLHRYIADLATYGRTTARDTYGCRGWTAHTVANVWGFTAPSGCVAWGLFPTAGSWLATHLWSHYLYTGDLDFLRQEAYPLLKGNALFLLDYLSTDPRTGYLVSGPSISPENGFRYEGQNHSACLTPTVDRVLAYEIFSDCIRASELLGVDTRFADTLRQRIAQLPPIRINRYGGIAEWGEDYEEAFPNHRHMSHLLALYPFRQITLIRTPELAKGAAATIERRLTAEGWEDVEWSRANAVCFYARLREAEKAYGSLNQLIGGLSRENLFTVSPKGIAGAPWDIFAIDGNTAGAAGLAEMLVQWHEGYIELLPCLPAAWADGAFSGICVPGLEISAEWHEGQLTSAEVRCRQAGIYEILLPGKEGRKLHLTIGETVKLL